MIQLAITKIFNDEMSLDQIDFNQIVSQLAEIICESNIMVRSDYLRECLFYLLSHVTRKMIEANDKQYFNMCLLNEIVNSLIGYFGRLNKNYKVKKEEPQYFNLNSTQLKEILIN